MKLTEKMSYLQGLLDGLDLDKSTKEGKALVQMSEVMHELVLYVEDLQSQVDELTELWIFLMRISELLRTTSMMRKTSTMTMTTMKKMMSG